MFGMYYAFKSFVTEPMRIKEEEAKAKAKAEAKVKAEAEAKARAAAEAARRAAAVAAAAAAPAASKFKAAVPAAPKPAFKPKAAPVKTTSIDESFLTLKSVKETYDAVKGKFKAIAKMALRGGHALTVTMPADVFSIQSGSQASGVGAPSFSLKESSTGAEAAFDTSNNKLSLKASVFEAEDIDVTAKCAIHGGKVMPTLEAKYSAPAVLDGATLNAAVDFSAKKASLKVKATQKDVELLDGDGTLTYKLETGVKGGEAQGGAAVIASLPEDSLHSLKLCASVGNVGGDEEKCDGGMRLAASVLPYDPLNLKVTAAINKVRFGSGRPSVDVAVSGARDMRRSGGGKSRLAFKVRAWRRGSALLATEAPALQRADTARSSIQASAVSATVDLESSHTVLEDIAGGFKVALGVRAVPAVELKKLSLEKTWTF